MKTKLSCRNCGNEIGTGYNTSNIGFCAASCFAGFILQAADKAEYQEEQADGDWICPNEGFTNNESDKTCFACGAAPPDKV